MIILATLLLLAASILVAFLVKLFLKLTSGICKSRRRLDGKVAIVTGANAGIGMEIAKGLAKRGARVILACRDVVKAELVCEQIKKKTNNDDIEVRHLDASNLKSVREFANSIIETESRLDILINNAGVAGLRRRITEDGLESQFATNYFGPFLLTNMLIPLMEATGNGRIVLVSSEMHRLGTDLDLDNLNAEKKWIGKKIYPWNKLCQVLFMRELHRKLRDADSTIAINSLHPGAVRTEIFNTAKGPVQFLASTFWWYFKSPWEGAQTPLFLAVSEEVEGVSGFYWTECKKTKPSSIIKDKELSRKLWDITVQMVKMEQKDNPVIKV